MRPPAFAIATEPVLEPVTFADMQSHSRITGTTDQTYVETLITAARKYVEFQTGRALITQTWDQYLQDWPSGDYIRVGKPPLQSVTYVKYTDSDGDETTWSTDYYDVDTHGSPGLIRLGYGDTWPNDTLTPTNPINIRFVAGYGDAAADVPMNLKHAIKLLAAHWYENREPVLIGSIQVTLPWAIDALLADYRIWTI
jgi:uncharacterized phiE125 gp8 family phage protein